jgi:hypothetical protein
VWNWAPMSTFGRRSPTNPNRARQAPAPAKTGFNDANKSAGQPAPVTRA